MLVSTVLLLAAAAYMVLLFAIASFGDRRAAAGRSLINSSVVYALSLAVYCTSWTFYGSVGRAAARGLDFLPIYLGPTLIFCLGWVLLSPGRSIPRPRRSGVAPFGVSPKHDHLAPGSVESHLPIGRPWR